jgi:hypothetical protein
LPLPGQIPLEILSRHDFFTRVSFLDDGELAFKLDCRRSALSMSFWACWFRLDSAM